MMANNSLRVFSQIKSVSDSRSTQEVFNLSLIIKRAKTLLNFDVEFSHSYRGMMVSNSYIILCMRNLIVYDLRTNQRINIRVLEKFRHPYLSPDDHLLDIHGSHLTKYNIENLNPVFVWQKDFTKRIKCVCADSTGLLYVSTYGFYKVMLIISPEGGYIHEYICKCTATWINIFFR